MRTLLTTMTDNIGQMTEEQANNEIIRMNRQDNTSLWRKDYSEFMEVIDETDDEMNNPCMKREDYVWVTCTPASEPNYIID